MVLRSVMALEAIQWLLRPFRGFQSYSEGITGHFYCKNALFHRPFWCLGRTGKDFKIILGEFLEHEGHVKFFLETGLDGKGIKYSLKVDDFCTFLGGQQGTSMLTDLAQIWNHEAFGVPLHLWSPFLLVPSLIRPSWLIYQNWSNLAASLLCGPTVTLWPFWAPKSAEIPKIWVSTNVIRINLRPD